MKRNTRKGFTLTELVIVIAVIAILAAVMIPSFSNMITKANHSAALQEARNMYTAYVADFDYSGGQTPATNMVVKVEANYIVIQNSQVNNTIYVELSAAKEAAGDDAIVVCDTCTYDKALATGKCVDCGKVCSHDGAATGGTCTTCGLSNVP